MEAQAIAAFFLVCHTIAINIVQFRPRKDKQKRKRG